MLGGTTFDGGNGSLQRDLSIELCRFEHTDTKAPQDAKSLPEALACCNLELRRMGGDYFRIDF